MERPDFKKIFGDKKTLQDVHQSITSEPELFQYAQKLDFYVDYLENELERREGKEPTHDAPDGGLSKHAVNHHVCQICKDTGWYFVPNFGGGGTTQKCLCGANGG